MSQLAQSVRRAPIQYQVQFLRAFAASMVVIHHLAFQISSASLQPFLLRTYPALAEIGAAGVDVFFVISGFIIFYSMTERAGPAAAASFLWHRFVRVVPLYWLWTTVLIAGMLAGVALTNTRLTPPWVVASYALIPYEVAPGRWHPILDQGWTLSFEIYFYLVAGLTITILPLKRRLFGLAAVMVAIQIASHLGSRSVFLTNWIGSSLIYEFLAGGAVAWWYRFGGGDRLGRRPLTAALLLALGLAGFVLSILVDVSALPRILSWGLPSVLIVLAAVLVNRAPTGQSGRLMVALGAASYSLYLTHVFAAILLGGLMKRGFLQAVEPHIVLVVATLVVIALGSASYWIVEKPLLGLFRRNREPSYAMASA